MQRRRNSPDLGHFIYDIRGQRVMLDSDLAPIYGVTTKRFNEQVRRNQKRFPNDFAFQLTAAEAKDLRCQSGTLKNMSGEILRSQNATTSGDSVLMRSQIATASKRNVRYRPWAFTEHGALQIANILRSDRAIAMSVYVIRAFIELRDKVTTNAAILKRLAEIDKTLLLHDSALRDVYQKLRPLLTPPPDPVRPRIGFAT